MTTLRVAEQYDRFRSDLFARRAGLSWTARLGLACLMAGVTGLAAQIRIPLGFTPVPLTGQVFAVLLSGVLLGGAWGAVSQILYVGIGALGMPWFSGGAAVAPLGPTGGYLLGFIPAALLIGWCTERWPVARRFGPQVALMLAGVAVIYLFGAAVFAMQMRTGLALTLQLAVLPFVALDIAKAVAAAGIAAVLLPRDSHPGDGNQSEADG